MILGDPNIFAIEISPEFRDEGRIFGRFSAHAAGLKIGYADGIVMLAIAESSLERSLKDVGHRPIPINTDDMQRLWTVLESSHSGDSHCTSTSLDDPAQSQRWASKGSPGYFSLVPSHPLTAAPHKDDSDEPHVHVPAIHRYVVLTGFSESFDGVMCFLVEKDDSEILLWKEHDGNGTLNVAITPPGYYGQIVEELLKGAWKEEL